MRLVLVFVPALLAVSSVARGGSDYPLTQLTLRDVSVGPGFWGARLETNRAVTVKHVLDECERTGRLSNFAKAAGKMEGKFQGLLFDDSDVYKAIEGAAYTLIQHPDPELEKRLNEIIASIAAAQQADGYLNTYFTLVEPDERWADLRNKHELYCAGHLFEAAVAHFEATGKRTLLDVATRLADHLVRRFGPGAGQQAGTSGHPEIELALSRLSRVTRKREYVELAQFFLALRGQADKRPTWGEYHQDHKPLLEQDEAVGHAVRAAYLYSGMLDVLALQDPGERAYWPVVDRLWNDVVGRKLYLTGGIGARAEGEAFGAAYELPNESAYAETCGAIAGVMWNWRMFRMTGDGKYLDVLERTLYNGFLAGVGQSGDRFFYPNPLACDGVRPFNHGSRERQAWFSCACCPVNVVRFMPQIPAMAYAQSSAGNDLYVNLFMNSTATFIVDGFEVQVTQTTDYPWDGRVRIAVDAGQGGNKFALCVRVPGWAIGRPAPSDLYHYAPGGEAGEVAFEYNGRPIPTKVVNGFATFSRFWRRGDVITVQLPMAARRVAADARVKEDVGRVALEHGPLVYCIEGADHAGHALDVFLPDDAELRVERREGLLGGVGVLCATAQRAERGQDGAVRSEPIALTAIPYYAWCERGANAMAVWIARDNDHVRLAPPPTIASRAKVSASHCWGSDTPAAMNDQVLPERSSDGGLPRFTWWSHRGTREWAEYGLREPVKVSAVEVYWFDDTGRGYCRVPASWRLMYREGEAWKPVRAAGSGGSDRGADAAFGVAADRFNRVAFEPVTTDGLRLEVQLQKDFSAGILEWRVE